MANDYIVVTVSGENLIIEEAFGDNREAMALLASGTGTYVMHGYN